MKGIIGYGAYLPKYRIKTSETARIWGKDSVALEQGLRIKEKSVPALDEDSLTIGYQAAANALSMAQIDPAKIGAIYFGSESKAYAVKPNASIVGEMLGAGSAYTSADVEFACKAGTACLQMVLAEAGDGMIDYGLAIGTDTAQGRPGDILEYSTAAGGAAFIVGSQESEMITRLEATCSSSSDTPDFWRRPHERFPVHRERFSGAPSYQTQILQSTQLLFDKLGSQPADYTYAAFHTPNGKFPLAVAKKLGFTRQQIDPGYVVPVVGNTYSGASILAFAAILDQAKPGDRILLVSYGSGAGSDAFSWVVTDQIDKKRQPQKAVQRYIDNKEYVDYGQYVKNLGLV